MKLDPRSIAKTCRDMLHVRGTIKLHAVLLRMRGATTACRVLLWVTGTTETRGLFQMRKGALETKMKTGGVHVRTGRTLEGKMVRTHKGCITRDCLAPGVDG